MIISVYVTVDCKFFLFIIKSIAFPFVFVYGHYRFCKEQCESEKDFSPRAIPIWLSMVNNVNVVDGAEFYIFTEAILCNKKANIIIIKDHKTLISFCYRKMSYFEHETILSDVS